MRSIVNKKRRHSLEPDLACEEMKSDIEIFKYFQEISEKKQISLLHSALSGRLNEEGRKFMKYIYYIKKKHIYKRKFINLINHAFPGIFLNDVNKDYNHYKWKLDDFQFVDYGKRSKVYYKSVSKFQRSKSFEDIQLHISSKENNNLNIKKQTLKELRRKSWWCANWGEMKLTKNQKLAMQLQNPGFSVNHSKIIILHPELIKASYKTKSSIQLPQSRFGQK